jgi:hypothetical protein
MDRNLLKKYVEHSNVCLIGAHVPTINEHLVFVNDHLNTLYNSVFSCLIDISSISLENLELSICNKFAEEITKIHNSSEVIDIISLKLLLHRINSTHKKRFVLNVMNTPDALSYDVMKLLMKLQNSYLSWNLGLHKGYHNIPDQAFVRDVIKVSV